MIDQELLHDLTESYLKSLISGASGSLKSDFDSFAAFGELGINSFQVLTIIKKLEDDFGTLPKSLLFECFNTNDLANYFVEKYEETLAAKFAETLQGDIVHTEHRQPKPAAAPEPAVAAEPAVVRQQATLRTDSGTVEGTPILILEKDLATHRELKELVDALFRRYKIEGSVSRGTRRIAPNLFIGSAKRGYFNYGRNKSMVVVYSYTGPRDYVPVLLEELYRYYAARGVQVNILADQHIPSIGDAPFSATPFGVMQRIVNLNEFTLDGGAMRRLRYQVSKFQKSGTCRTVEYRCGSTPETDQQIAAVIDRWCESRTVVNPLVHDVKAEIVDGTLSSDHRVFLTYLDDVLQNAILITAMSAEENGYLMDLEFYLPDMPLGGLEFAIVRIIEVLVSEGCRVLSLGGTYGCKLEPCASADPEVDRILDELRAQSIFNDEGNLQFKNKFRPENKPIYLCRPVGSGNPDNVIDIIMMIADPVRMQTPEEGHRAVSAAQRDVARVIEKPAATRSVPSEAMQPGISERLVIDADDRSSVLTDCGFNPLNLSHEHVVFDLKTDSWAQLETPAIQAQMRHLHGQLQQPLNVEDSLRTVFPFAHFVLTSSGQAAEHVFFKAWPKRGTVPENLLFPSTIFHQIDNGFTPRELPHPAVFHLDSEEAYKGNMAWEALEALVAQDPAALALVCIEVSNNAAGGNPVSLQHLRNLKTLLGKESIPLVIDATRVVENAQFLIEHEKESAGESVWAVVREILSCGDAVIGSLTKDFCVNKGGIIATNDAKLFHRMQELCQEEGAGIDRIDRALIALSLRNRRNIEAKVLRRMEVARGMWQALKDHGVPVMQPAGGHCVVIAVKQIPEFMRLSDPVASFLAWIYLNTGIRAGAHSVGMQKGTPINDLVRLAIPVGLTREEADSVIDRLVQAFEARANIPEITMESGSAQPLDGVYASYKLVRYHNISRRSSESADVPNDAHSLRASPAPAREPSPGKPEGGTQAPPVFEQPQSVRVGPTTNATTTRDVAIIGMAGRYPRAKNVRELWDNLAQGRDCIEDIPAQRYAQRVQHGSTRKYRGGFIDDVDRFDSLFFNISPREAEILDPQERLFLEVAWEAIEDAGYYPEVLAQDDASRNVGVFVGAVWAMYQILGVEEKHLGNTVVPNSFLWSVANRVSYVLNLTGPSLTLDTACSSSLTAIYLAFEAIQSGECSAALVGGVNLDLHQAKFDINHQGGALSPDGVCRTFGKGANGYVMGEGVGALFLKPLDRALQDRDHVYGVIKTAVINHGGRTSGYTVPNPKAQAELVSAALEKAKIDARSIGYIEAHGTGTELGDPLEITGLSNAFESYAVGHQACAIGSIKTNIGHLEAAAGVVGVSKVLLQMKHRKLVPSLHSSELNEFIDFEHSPFYVVQALEEWNAKEVDGVRVPLRAGISSFGAGGSNAHIILEDYEPAGAEGVQSTRSRPAVFPLSARNEEQLREAAARLARFLQQNDVDLNNVAYTLQQGRKSFEHRLALIAKTQEELIERLHCFINGKPNQDIVTGHVKAGEGITRLLNRREKQEFIRLVSQGSDPHKIAALWAEGLFADWQGFQSECAGTRISLPTYAFADKRHWASGASRVRGALQPTASVHPIIDTNESTFERQLFKKTFHDRDFFIYDHHVSDIPTLPGVAYLEFARKAGEIAAGRKVQKIKNILWISPIAVQNSTPKEVFIELKPSGESVQFEVFSQDATGNKTPHSQGKLLYATKEEMAAEPEYIDLEVVRARCAKVVDGSTAYPIFKSFGLNLGPSFQVLQDVYKSEIETLGVLKLPDVRGGDLQSMVLHPSLVDGSLQAGMAAQIGGQGGGMLVPFSIGEVEILQPLQPDCLSYVTQAKEEDPRRSKSSTVVKSNVLIVDATGKILVRIRESVGVPLRDIYKKAESNADAEGFSRLYYSYDWEKAPLAVDHARQEAAAGIVFFDIEGTLRDGYRARSKEAGTNADQVILVRPGDAFQDLDGQSYTINPQSRADFTRLFQALIEKGSPVENICFAWSVRRGEFRDETWLKGSLERGVYSFLFVCQALTELKLENKVQLLYLYSRSQDDAQPQNEAVSGFVNTVRIEYPRLLCKTLEIRQDSGGDEEILDVLSAELQARTQDAAVVRYEAQERFIKRLKAFDLAEAAETTPSQADGVKDNGVYLITGGAGGLGLVFAEFLAREHRAKLVLTGRSGLSSELENRLEELRKNGAEVLYVPADVSDFEDAKRLVDEAKSRFGELNGVIHAAGVLRDSLIRNKTPEEMSAVFAPKIYGTLHLDELTKYDDLDFFVSFSSLAAVGGNGGQCDYSFANYFMDAFAADRELRRAEGLRAGKTLSLNWSIWADGGMKLDEQTELYFKRTVGIAPLSAATGLDAFVRGLASGRSQFAVLEGIQEKVELAWGLKKKDAPAAVSPSASSGNQAASAGTADGGDEVLVASLQNDLSQLVMDMLKLDASDVAHDKILLDLGFDSIGLTAFANAVNEKYQLDITPVLFFDYPSISEISKYLSIERKDELLRFYGASAAAAPPAARVPAPQQQAQMTGAESQSAGTFEIRKGWDPAALEREATARPAAQGFAPELRFVNEPIAIVGMSGVMPQSEDLDEFWENLRTSTDMITVIPEDRWKWEDYYGDPLKEANKTNSKWGGFMKEVDKFDPLFFGISPREAQMMDPQQRIFLETVWKAIEDSGQRVSDLSGTKTGLFVGVATNDYIDVLRDRQAALDGYSASGNSHSVLANRVSFLLNLHGPSAPIDTACSSSLVALHRAIESIHTRSCDMAIVGGVQVNLSPGAFISFGAAGMLSPDGKCKSFDKRANGYVRGEGSGAIFLKRLSAAESDGNHIYAVIKATAENHGGKVTTLTAPNSSAQAELLVEAYEKAQVDPTTVGYIECHGTGTSLGDPIEIQALTKAFAELYKKGNKAPATVPHCGLSSVKTNIGHLETAAGVAGILKALLAIKHKQIPANIHFEEINPYINLKGTPFYIADKLTPWESPIAADGSPAPRRAGVSSFGFGGANAHIVLEEYVPAGRPSAPAAHEPQLIVLSAKNEDRLKAYVRSMLAYIDKNDVDLADFAYTLQVGRDEMPERLALVASSTEDLKEKFAAILSAGDRPKDSYRNNTTKKDSKPQPGDASAGASDVQALLDRKELPRLAELWVAGAKVDWRLLHKASVPRRISVPTYPFAMERYWVPAAEGKATKAREATALALLHPLIHRNTSTLEEQKFSSTFSGEEFYLADHVVETHKILPGVAYLEMARVAGELSGNARVRVIRNLTWERPLIVESGGKEVEVSLAPLKGEVTFAVRTGTGESAITLCTGRLGYQADGAGPEVLDIAGIKARCSEQVLAGKDLYPILSDAGLKLGRSFQVVQSIYATESESLAILKLPEHLEADAGQFWLHPALMDGSLHTAVGLATKSGMNLALGIPYSVGEVQILHPVKDLHYGYATWAEEGKLNKMRKVDFHLLDKSGRVLVRLKGFVPRPLQMPSTRASQGAAASRPEPAVTQETVAADLQSLLPVWNPLRLASERRVAPPESSNILLLGSDATQLDWVRTCYPNARLLELARPSGADAIEKKLEAWPFDQLLWIAPDARPDDGRESVGSERILEEQEEGVLAVFRIVKALLRLGHANRKLQWTFVSCRTQRVTEGEPIQPAHAAIIGLVGSLAKEYPQWDLRVLDLDSLASVAPRECLSLPWDKQGDVLAHRKGEWFQQQLALIVTLPQAAAPAYRQNGVYVVIGGAGGVGEVWSRFMIENYKANIVWIGRRELDASIKAKAAALGQFGPVPLYISADATNAAALEQARQAILEAHPAIHGVVHSAIVLQDQSIARMEEPTFRASLSAKVDVSVNMDRVFGTQELDFMLFFSSIVSFVKSPGQSNYAAGCTFKDTFAHALQQRRPYRIKIMNWGYWGNVGVVADASHNKMMAQMGIGSIEPDEGMAALRTLVGCDMHQMVLVKTLTNRATAGLQLTETVACQPQTAPPVLPQVQRILDGRVLGEPVAALEAERPTPEMMDFVTDLLASSLTSLGLFSNGIRRLSELPLEKQPAAYYERWLSTSARYLQQQHVLADDLMLGRDIRPLADLWAEWEAQRSAWVTGPNRQAQVALLEACLKAVPGILTARQLATDAMFPNSSMHLVEGIYHDNVLANHFNDVLGEVLSACIEQELATDRQREIRILEIGAGTGGTTARLLPLLQRLPITEYCYTDVSRAFLMYAEKQFRPQLPALTTAIFDVTKPLATQGVRAGHYDFAIAANVLHATPDIRETLRNAKAALKNQGVLLLNEIATWSLFNHLTFGLLEGWWLHEDTAVRLPGSPGLAPEKWREVLAAEGFESILFPAEATHAFGQQIVAAGSNGWTRQHTVKVVSSPRSAGAEHTDGKAMDVDAKTVGGPAAPAAQVNEQRSSDYVRQLITEKLSEALRLDAGLIRNDAPFADYGVDSIIGVNFVRTISEALRIELETTSLFEYSTVDQLTEYIQKKWHDEIAAQLAPAPGDAQQTVTRSADEAPAATDTRSTPRFVVAPRFDDARGVFAAGPESDSRSVDVEPIAIVGMSGRFAESESLDAFWQNLAGGESLIRKVSRWRAADCVMSESSAQAYCSHGSFVDSIDQFDPAFFGISAEEATYMDPQQRLFLEEAWKALEDAGYAGKDVHEKQCGVYVGCGSSYYERLAVAEPPAHAFWGNSQAVLPARIAYYLNLQGPAIAVDTACSSSLVTIHLGCQGLWSRETEMALAGGVFLQATPGFYQVANRAGMLSPDGQCHSFDARANGFVPGEGVGVVVLKRLSDALRDGDHIHGVIAGSGINQDGRSNGLIAPNGRAQERLERSVYERFKIDPATIQVVEAHATGTPLGDSIEYGAISRSFREYTDKKQFCALGTVKMNIGHAATAAGVAGVLKLLLSLKHRQIPPSPHFEKANPAIDLDSGPFYINTQLREWEVADDETRRAAISAFGFSGTNAHLVIEQAPSIERGPAQSPAYLVVLSARTPDQLKQQAQNLLELVKRTLDLSMNDLSFSLFVGRMHLRHRLSCVARNQRELVQLLERWVATGTAGNVWASETQEGKQRENGALKKFGNYCIQECRNAASADTYLENLEAIADLYVQGYGLEYQALFSGESKRIPLPTYPFARERYWVDAGSGAASSPAVAPAARLHPLLHSNTSTLGQHSYRCSVTGAESFVKDHQGVMPGVAYLEMARAALEAASPNPAAASIVELEDTVWGQPMVASGKKEMTIALFADDDDRVSYEICSGAPEQESVHCQGRAFFSDRAVPPPLDIDELQAQMERGKLDAASVYARFAKSGVSYGPAHQAIAAVHLGDQQVLGRLSLPRAADAGGYSLHPSLVSGAVQVALVLIADVAGGSATALVPRDLEHLSVLSACTEEMFAWVRYAQASPPGDALPKLDIDLLDARGRVCAQMRGLSFQADGAAIEAQIQPTWRFVTDISMVGDDAEHIVPMDPEEKVTLFLKQEAAIQLKRPLDEIPTDRSYFDLGLSSLAITKLVQDANRFLGEDLSPSALFDYNDIQSLAAYLAATFTMKIDAVMAIRREVPPPRSKEPRHGHAPHLTPLARKASFAGRPVRPSSRPTPAAAAAADKSGERVLADLLWQETALADSYEKMTF